MDNTNVLNPILSGSFLNLLLDIDDNTGNPIVSELLRAHRLVETYNNVLYALDNESRNVLFDKICEVITDEVSALSFRMGVLEISYLPKDKEMEYSGVGTWSRKNRQSGKPAKIVQKLLRKEFKPSEWETFSNLLKSEICDCLDFKIVSGEDIRKWYNEENYYQIKGSLGNSCMRYPSAQPYFDIYVDHAKMLITTKNGSLTGRALVWEVDGVTLLDRIYTTEDYLVECFITYAKDHGWWYREDNRLLNTGDDQGWYTPDDNYTDVTYREFRIKLNESYEYYPYVDSFRYFNGCIISTNSKFGEYTLDHTDGDYEDDTSWWECAECGESFRGYGDDMPDGLHYSSWADSYYCDDCCWYCELLDDYIPNSEETATIRAKNRIYCVPDAYIDDHLIDEPDGLERYPDIVVINEEYHFVDEHVTFDEDNNCYVLA